MTAGHPPDRGQQYPDDRFSFGPSGADAPDDGLSFGPSGADVPDDGHSFSPPSDAPAGPGPAYHYPAPTGATAGPPPASRTQRTERGAGGVLVAAGLTAVLLGGAAGFGGARLADRTAEPAPAASTVATSAPTSRGSAVPLPPAPPRLNTVAVAKAVVPSTVMIKARSGSNRATGSGFVLDRRGRILTNNHVIAKAADRGSISVVFSNGSRTSATLVGRSPSYDLAVLQLKAPANLQPMQIGNSDAAQVGESVLAVGSPLGLPGTVTEGIVSAKDRPVAVNVTDAADDPRAYINGIQTDAPINPGNSGGPLVDAAARVIGVNSAILTLGEDRADSGNIGLGFAIPINQAMQIATLLIKDGKATYPVIGADVTSSDTSNGVRLRTVVPRGPAARAGLRVGDVVTKIDARRVYEVEELIVAIRTHRPREVIQLEYRRGSAGRTVPVTLDGKEG